MYTKKTKKNIKKITIKDFSKIDLVHKNKEKLVDFILQYYKNNIAVEYDKEDFTSSNYIFWITNNLYGMYSNTNKKGLEKLIDGPSHKIIGDKITKKIVIDTHKHVKKLLMKLPTKDLYSLIGYGIYYH
jgi:hypothetical protein